MVCVSCWRRCCWCFMRHTDFFWCQGYYCPTAIDNSGAAVYERCSVQSDMLIYSVNIWKHWKAGQVPCQMSCTRWLRLFARTKIGSLGDPAPPSTQKAAQLIWDKLLGKSVGMLWNVFFFQFYRPNTYCRRSQTLRSKHVKTAILKDEKMT